MNASEHPDTCTLIGGLTVPTSALRLAWDLEARGLRIQLDDDGGLLVGPSNLLNDDDRKAIRVQKWALVELVKYEPPQVN